MTDQQAEKVSKLINTKKEIASTLGMFVQPLVFNIKVKDPNVMYLSNDEGYNLELDKFSISNKELSDFITKKLSDRLKEVNEELLKL